MGTVQEAHSALGQLEIYPQLLPQLEIHHLKEPELTPQSCCQGNAFSGVSQLSRWYHEMPCLLLHALAALLC